MSDDRGTYFYTANIAPIGRPFRIPSDDGAPTDPILFDASTFDAQRQRPWHIPVRLHHDRIKRVGCLSDLRAGKEWWLAEFMLDPALSSVLEVGQPVSIGLSTMLASGNHYLSELSLVRRGAVKGAEVTSRRELKPTPTASPSSTLSRRDVLRRMPDGSIERDLPDGSVEITHRRGPLIRRQFETEIKLLDHAPTSAASSSVVRRLQSMPEDGFCTLYDEHGNELSRVRLA